MFLHYLSSYLSFLSFKDIFYFLIISMCVGMDTGMQMLPPPPGQRHAISLQLGMQLEPCVGAGNPAQVLGKSSARS